MSNYSQFFLNTSSSIVQLELIEIFHPYFTKTYRLVRNAIAGVTVTLEDTSVQTFDYYPLQITPTGSDNDLDQTLQLQFGDLGEILPLELDLLTIKPKYTTKITKVNPGALIGAWVDATGQLIAPPFLIGNDITLLAPIGPGYKLQMGMNDTFFGDNVGAWSVTINGGSPITVGGTAAPWVFTAGINSHYPFPNTGAAAPISVAVAGGSILHLVVTGTAGLIGGDLRDGLGDPTIPLGVGTSPGIYVNLDYPPNFNLKPLVTYRTYRSDDLTAPLSGPHKFQANNIAFQKVGATFQCTAPRANLSGTGELYSLDRFPMLRGFL